MTAPILTVWMSGQTPKLDRLSPAGRLALAAFIAHTADHGQNQAAPSSRQLRQHYAPYLSRRQWAQATEELRAIGALLSSPGRVLVSIPSDAL